MPTFNYIAKDKSGKEVKGSVEAVDKKDAASQLRSQSLLVYSLLEQEEQSPANELPKRHSLKDKLPVTNKDRVLFYRQLALMVRSGLTLVNALNLLQEEFPNFQMRSALAAVLDDVRKGRSFSASLSMHEKIFTRLGVKIVETTEESGELEQGLLKVAEHIEFWGNLKKKAMSAVAYPAVIFILAIGVGAFLVFKIIPKFDEFMQKRSIVMPWSTSIVVHISRFFTSYWLFILLGLIVFFTSILLAYRTENGKRLLERFCLKVPVLGSVIRFASITNISSTMSVLLRSGLGLIDALRLTSQMLGILVYREAVSGCASRVITGVSFKDSLNSPLFPRIVQNVVSVGEETGELNQALEELGEFYSEELKRTVEFIVNAIEPLLLICVGSLVALVYFALFQAVISLMAG